MKKFILQNQKGMSLVEVTVAAAISVMVAMGVMQINQNANKSLKTMTAKTDLGNFQDRIKSRLSKSENCIAAQVNGGNAFTGRDITNATTLNTGAFNSRGSGDDEFTFGQPIPTARDWKVDSVVINGFDNGSGTSVIGECDLTFNLTKVKNNAIYGSENKSFTIQMSCQVDNVSDNIVQSCASIIDADEEGHWIAHGEGYIEFNGVTGNPRIRVGPASGGTITGSAVDAALTLDPIGAQDAIDIASGNANFLGSNGLLWGDPAGNNVTMIGNSAGTIDINGGGGFVRIISQTSGSDQSIRNLDGLYTDFIGPKGTDNYVSIGTPGSHTIYLSSTDITGTLVTNSDVTVGDDLTVNDQLIVNDDITVSDDLTVGDLLTVNDDISVSDDITVGDQVSASRIRVDGAVVHSSDERLKYDINSIEGASDILSDLRGVTYFMRKDEFPSRNFDDKLKYGLIAQEVQRVLPELVTKSEIDDYLGVDYNSFISILIQAHNEQAEEIKKNQEIVEIMRSGLILKNTEQDSRLETLEKENELLKNRIKSLESKMDKILNLLEEKNN